MDTPLPLLPSNASCSSLDSTAVSSASMPSPRTTDDSHDGDEERLLRQTKKLSQIFGELPTEVRAQLQPHLARCSMPAVEAPSTHPSQQPIRISRHSFIDSASPSFCFPPLPHSDRPMSPQLLSSARDALGRSNSTRHSAAAAHPSHVNEVDSARFGLGRLRRAGSTRSTQHDEKPRPASQLSIVAEGPARSSSLRLLNHVHPVRPRDNLRRRSVHNPANPALHTHSRQSPDIFTPTHSQRKSMSLWTRRRMMKDDSAHQRHSTADQNREDDASSSSHPPLTEAQRVQSLRRGRKLAQLFGAEPPIAMYKVTSPFEDEPTSPNTIARERAESYFALSSTDPLSRHSSRSSLSSISESVAYPSSDSATHETDPSHESERDQTPAVPPLNPDVDVTPVSQDSSEPLPLDDVSTATFRRRRLRAAKLSRFFGVTYNDISTPIAMSTPRHRTDGEAMTPEEVGVKIQERGWFWNRTESNHTRAGGKEADMNDVIALLRQMPRA